MMPQPIWLLLFRRFTLRHGIRSPGQTAILIAIVALGVAVFLSIRLANRAVLSSFEEFSAMTTRSADFVISAPAGSLRDQWLAELRARLGPRAIHIIPVLESSAATLPEASSHPSGNGITFSVLGLDLVGLQNLREESAQSFTGRAGVSLMADAERPVFISQALAKKRGLAVGQKLSLLFHDAPFEMDVGGIIPESPGLPAPPETLLLIDLPLLQELTGRAGELDRIEFIVERGANHDRQRDEAIQILSAEAHGRWILATGTERRAAGAVMTEGFRLNLTVLSLLALAAGLYLVFQALDGAVVRRREEIAVLRSLGVEAGAIRTAWLLESLLVGLVGGALGILLGWGGAQVSVQFVGRTVNALYFANSAAAARLEWDEGLIALGLAAAAAIAAGWAPARAAAETPPAESIRRYHPTNRGPWLMRSRTGAFALAAIGLIAANAPPWRLAGGVRFAFGGYLAAICWLFAAGVGGGYLLSIAGACLRPLGRSSALLRLALSHCARPSGRHRLAVASLVCAVAMTAGMSILVGSFDLSMQRWIAASFQADLYLARAGAQGASNRNFIPPQSWRTISSDPSVEAANALQRAELTLPGGETTLVGTDFDFVRRFSTLIWIDGKMPSPDAPPDRTALVSESFVERFGLGRGAHLQLPTPSGPRDVQIAAVYAEYGNERGTVLIDRRTFASWFGHENASNLILKLHDPAASEALRASILAVHPGLQIYTNARLRSEILRVFHQTFSITYALEAIGLIVAVLGLALTLVSVQLERRDDLTTLRALGFSEREIAIATALEGLLIGLAGLLAGLVASLALGWLLILLFAIPAPELILLSIAVLSSALISSWAVGRWGAELPSDREE
jgi:putative ABC transport system permease protein